MKKNQNTQANHSHDHNHVHGPDCNHNHKEHVHGPDCNHDHHHHGHDDPTKNSRHAFSNEELATFESETIDQLLVRADFFLEEEDFGKVVPIFEAAYLKLQAEKTQDAETKQDILNIQQNLAFSYGIINEHEKSLPLWKTVIAHKEQNSLDASELLDDYFGVALSCEHCKMDEEFLFYIQKGLKLAKENKFEEYEASFEHELGGFYCDATQYDKAQSHFKKAIEIREKLHDILGLVMSKLYMGILFQEQNKFTEAKSFYENALELSKLDDFKEELLQEREELELRLSQIQNTNLKSKLLNI